MRCSGVRSGLAAASSSVDGRPLLRADAGARAIERLGEALGAERLQQVVDRVHLERADGVAVVGGDENDGDVAADELEHVEPVELRHLDVEHQQIGLQLGRCFHRLESVRALGDDLDVGVVGQPLAKNPARERFVIDDDDPNAVGV